MQLSIDHYSHQFAHSHRHPLPPAASLPTSCRQGQHDTSSCLSILYSSSHCATPTGTTVHLSESHLRVTIASSTSGRAGHKLPAPTANTGTHCSTPDTSRLPRVRLYCFSATRMFARLEHSLDCTSVGQSPPVCSLIGVPTAQVHIGTCVMGGGAASLGLKRVPWTIQRRQRNCPTLAPASHHHAQQPCQSHSATNIQL